MKYPNRTAPTIAIGLISLLCSTHSEVSAQPTKRLGWRFTAGDRFRLDVLHSADHQLEIGSQALKSNLEVKSRLSWNVVDVQGSEFHIELKVESTAVKNTLPSGEVVQYDSDSTTEPTGRAHELRETVKPLTGLRVELTMIPRGISELVIDPEVRAEVETNPAVHSVLAAVPEFPSGEVAAGQSWERTRSARDPQDVSEFERETFTYKGPAMFEGRPVELIVSRTGSTSHENLETEVGGRAAKFKSLVGARFDAKEGVLVTSKIRQQATVEMEFKGQAAVQTMDNTTTVRFTKE